MGYRTHGLNDRAANLRAQGYRLAISSQGYQVWAPSGDYLGGAGSLPRDTPKHWRHARADIEMHTETACLLAERHRAQAYRPKTGERCACKPGVHRDNCPECEGTGWRIDFAAIRARK